MSKMINKRNVYSISNWSGTINEVINNVNLLFETAITKQKVYSLTHVSSKINEIIDCLNEQVDDLNIIKTKTYTLPRISKKINEIVDTVNPLITLANQPEPTMYFNEFFEENPIEEPTVEIPTPEDTQEEIEELASDYVKEA